MKLKVGYFLVFGIDVIVVDVDWLFGVIVVVEKKYKVVEFDWSLVNLNFGYFYIGMIDIFGYL